jgi:hypothetical protein
MCTSVFQVIESEISDQNTSLLFLFVIIELENGTTQVDSF